MNNAGIWSGGLSLLFSLVWLVVSFQYDFYTVEGPGPGMLPRSLSVILLVLSLIYIGEALRKPVYFKDILAKRELLKKSGFVMICLIVYTALLKQIGFVLDTTALLYLLLRSQFRWYITLIIAVAVSLSLFILFEVILLLPLPVNVFGW